MLLNAGSRESLDLDAAGSAAGASRVEDLVIDSLTVSGMLETSIRGVVAAFSVVSPSEISAKRDTSTRGLVGATWGDSALCGGGDGELVCADRTSGLTARLKEDSLVRETFDESRVEFFLVTSTTFGRSLGALLRFTAWVCIVGESTRLLTDL
jgi:hypothetical protein